MTREGIFVEEIILRNARDAIVVPFLSNVVPPLSNVVLLATLARSSRHQGILVEHKCNHRNVSCNLQCRRNPERTILA